MMKQTDDLRKTHRVAVVVNAAVIGTLIIYALVIEILRRQFAPFEGFVEVANASVLRYIVYGIAVVDIFIIRLMRVSLLRKPPADDPNLIRAKLLRASIITAALCEIPAILGLVFFLLAGSIRDYYQLAGVSFILVFLHFPRYGNWEAWAQNSSEGISSCG